MAELQLSFLKTKSKLWLFSSLIIVIFVLSEIDHEAALEAAGATEPEAGNDRSPISMDTASPGTSSDSSDSAVAGPEASAVISEPQKPKPKIVARLVDFPPVLS